MLADLGLAFHWPPEVLLNLSLDDLLFWNSGAQAAAAKAKVKPP
jgi:hypothetical protein